MTAIDPKQPVATGKAGICSKKPAMPHFPADTGLTTQSLQTVPPTYRLQLACIQELYGALKTALLALLSLKTLIIKEY